MSFICHYAETTHKDIMLPTKNRMGDKAHWRNCRGYRHKTADTHEQEWFFLRFHFYLKSYSILGLAQCKRDFQGPVLWYAGIPYRPLFKSCLFHFRFSSLLMCLGKQQRMIQMLESLHPLRNLEEAPDSCRSPAQLLAVVAIRAANQWMEALSLCLSFTLSITVPFKVNLTKKKFF